jgi:arginyl-tRNA synthetase
MDDIALQLKKVIHAVVPELTVEEILVERPADSTHGDYATNIALSKFSKLKESLHVQKPLDAANILVDRLKKEQTITHFVSAISAAPPGFINFTLSTSNYLQTLNIVVTQGESYGKSEEGKGKTAIIDYSAPNIAKRFSIGHLRSTIIGNSLERLFEFAGWTVVSDNHLGDWGTQFGKMIVAVEKWATKPVTEMSIPELEALYVRFHEEAEKDPALDDEARASFKRLEDGNKKERTMWQQLVDGSMKEFNELYGVLGVKIDEVIGESFYENIMHDVISDAKKKNIAEESNGALVIPLPEKDMPPAMLLKKDGATTYLTRDLATLKYRKERWHPDLLIYEVGAEQAFHFKQVFWAGEMLGYCNRKQCVHVGHGMVRLKEGKMSTRKGRTIKLEEVLDKAIEKAKTFTSDEKLATIVGIGAVKFNDLKRAPAMGYTFDWDEAVNLEGNSGPYLQYTFVRCKSVLGKAGSIPSLTSAEYAFNTEEIEVIRNLGRFPEILVETRIRFAPSVLCHYLYELAASYSTFYMKHKILEAETQEMKIIRLNLTQAVMTILSTGLQLLGIQVPEKM